MEKKLFTIFLLCFCFANQVEAKKVKIPKGSAFSPAMKKVLIKINKKRNNGEIKCVKCQKVLVLAKQHKRGVTPPNNEAHVDHIVRRVHGGNGTSDNGQVLCRKCNLNKR